MAKRIPVYILLALIIAGGVLGFSYYSSSPSEPSASQKRQTWQEFVGSPEMSKVDPNKPLREQTRIFELAGRRFEIPIMYIDGRPKPGEYQESMLLEVIWPEVRSIWELKDRTEYNLIRKKEHRFGWILLHPASTRPPIETQIANLKRNIRKIDFVQSRDGLEEYLWYRGTPESPEPWYEMYFEKDTRGNIISYIDCSPKERGLYPRCSDKFIEGGLIYQISYNKAAFFSEWRQQRQRAIDFMNSFEIHSQKASTKEE